MRRTAVLLVCLSVSAQVKRKAKTVSVHGGGLRVSEGGDDDGRDQGFQQRRAAAN